MKYDNPPIEETDFLFFQTVIELNFDILLQTEKTLSEKIFFKGKNTSAMRDQEAERPKNEKSTPQFSSLPGGFRDLFCIYVKD